MNVVAFIPAYNEAPRIGAVIDRARRCVDQVVVIDDGSSDDTATAAKRPGIEVLRHERNLGKGAAIMTALEYFGRSDAEFAVFLDADGQHDPDEIPKFVEAACAMNADIVIGTRMTETRDMPWVRRLTNQFTSWVTSRLARQTIPDSQCGFRLIRRSVLPHLEFSSRHFETETEMLIQAGRAGHKIVTVPVRTIYGCEVGPSHIQPFRDTIRFLTLVAKYWMR
ncbi:MAG TPA: glycosyltransferase family 2 protein [Verrucomicrobiae bacterium]|nr:glycosyltransferase family 2 protein [Verrucomicrobiae bacterium]